MLKRMFLAKNFLKCLYPFALTISCNSKHWYLSLLSEVEVPPFLSSPHELMYDHHKNVLLNLLVVTLNYDSPSTITNTKWHLCISLNSISITKDNNKKIDEFYSFYNFSTCFLPFEKEKHFIILTPTDSGVSKIVFFFFFFFFFLLENVWFFESVFSSWTSALK